VHEGRRRIQGRCRSGIRIQLTPRGQQEIKRLWKARPVASASRQYIDCKRRRQTHAASTARSDSSNDSLKLLERTPSAILSLFDAPGGVAFSYLVLIKSMTPHLGIPIFQRNEKRKKDATQRGGNASHFGTYPGTVA
jgi:hypothetical protein